MSDNILDNLYTHEMTLRRKQGKVSVFIGEKTAEVSAVCSVKSEATVSVSNDAN